MIPILYWLIWLFSFLATGMLLVWHLPYYPFSDPGELPPEGAAVLVLLIMLVRWIANTILILIVNANWLQRRVGLSDWSRRVIPVALVAGQALLGLTNFWVWQTWIGTGGGQSHSAYRMLAALYFAIPLTILVSLAAAKWMLPSEEASRPALDVELSGPLP